MTNGELKILPPPFQWANSWMMNINEMSWNSPSENQVLLTINKPTIGFVQEIKDWLIENYGTNFAYKRSHWEIRQHSIHKHRVFYNEPSESCMGNETLSTESKVIILMSPDVGVHLKIRFGDGSN